MDDKILIAIISAGSAIIGGLVPAIFSYFTKKKELKSNLDILQEQSRISRDSTNIEIRRCEYSKFIDALQKERNTGSNFVDFQNSVNKILLFADHKTAVLINAYYTDICYGSMGRQTALSNDKHDEYQQKIINSMRYDLGVSCTDIDNILIATYSKW